MKHQKVRAEMLHSKGQAAILGLLFAFMLIATIAIIQEPLLDFISIGINATSNTTAHSNLIITIMNILPVFI